METLTKQIKDHSLTEFRESVKSELSVLSQDPNRLKVYVALLLLGKELVEVLEAMPLEGFIQQLKDELRQLGDHCQKLDENCQLHLSENESILHILSGKGEEAEFNELQNQIKKLLRQQDDLVRQIVVQHEKLSFETIAAAE